MKCFILAVLTVLLVTPEPGRALPKGWEESALNHLRRTQSERVNLEALHIAYPEQAVDLFALYRENLHREKELHGVVRRPKNQKDDGWFLTWTKQGFSMKPILVRYGQSVISSLDHIGLIALSEICNAVVRPSELVVTAKAGVDFYASFKGEVSLKFDPQASCPGLGLFSSSTD